MKILLLAGYTPDRHHPSPALQHYQSQFLIDWQIEQLKKIQREVVVIIGGAHAEAVLRSSRRLESCDLVFDTHGSEVSPWTNLQSGLYLTEEWVFVLPVEILPPERSVWMLLREEVFKLGLRTGWHVIATRQDPQSCIPATPLLVTRAGNNFIKKSPEITGWSDPRLAYLWLEEPNLQVVRDYFL